LPGTRTIDLRTNPAGKPLVERFRKGFEYSDCWVDDARLVLLNAMDAAQRGARIATRSRVTRASRRNGVWEIELERADGSQAPPVLARTLVNAAGPWVDKVIHSALVLEEADAKRNVRLVRGSHIVVRRLFDHDSAYIFQNKDGRVFFAIPYEQDFTLIGTTDTDHDTSLDAIHASEDEIAYLCTASAEYFKRPVRKEDVVWTYSGVRPLYDDGASAAQEATRDYVFKLETENGAAPLLNIFGGKITTYRRLAQAALKRLSPYLSIPDSDWTRTSPLPGGDFHPADVHKMQAELQSRYPFIGSDTARRLLRSYGLLAGKVLGNARNKADLGVDFGAGLSEAEVRYMIENEWATGLDDIIWRRSKLGLRLSDEQKKTLGDWLATHRSTKSNNSNAAA
jgi:glycerol-3-phosphate dehydrogenase